MIPRQIAQRTFGDRGSELPLEGAIKVTRGVIKKFRMWRTCYIAQKLENRLVFLAF
jgi:hypothetical protein